MTELATIMGVDIGAEFTSRTGSKYTVVGLHTCGGFTIKRASSGKTVRISGRMLGRTLVRISKGESFVYQANATKGGISYTVAIEAGVVFAMGDLLTRDDTNRCYISRGA